ncbi:MAG: hypothetical protein R3176_06270 [Woeseiaceae bacterium]|nr:hypothetical protein [Woeseiaceae bacterium]
MRASIPLLYLLAAVAQADAGAGGHLKLRLEAQAYPEDSLFRDLAGSETIDVGGDLRLEFAPGRGRWTLDAAWQLIGFAGDSIEWTRDTAALPGIAQERLPDDGRRLFDLTHVIRDRGRGAVLHRLDRLAVRYAGESTVIRIGRQALSWGNGLAFAPMDLVNPFDPVAVDTEFKAGDDMLYGQYLRRGGDDLQAAVVFRRDPVSDSVTADSRTSAVKYHGFGGSAEFDVLVAEHYGDLVLGAGLVQSVGGAVVRGDAVVTDTGDEYVLQAVANVSYAWTWRQKNMSGALEVYFNGFGQPGGDYGPAGLAGNPALVARLARGEMFTLGRRYVAASVLVEMTPLWSLTPTLIANVDDPSVFLQLVTRLSLSDNLDLLGSLNVPVGAGGTEYGGIDSGQPGTDLATGPGLFAQLAWYF